MKWAKKFKDKIQETRENELESIKEKLGLAKEHRVIRLSGLLDKLENELDERDISDMPAASLMRIYPNNIFLGAIFNCTIYSAIKKSFFASKCYSYPNNPLGPKVFS